MEFGLSCAIQLSSLAARELVREQVCDLLASC